MPPPPTHTLWFYFVSFSVWESLLQSYRASASVLSQCVFVCVSYQCCVSVWGWEPYIIVVLYQIVYLSHTQTHTCVRAHLHTHTGFKLILLFSEFAGFKWVWLFCTLFCLLVLTVFFKCSVLLFHITIFRFQWYDSVTKTRKGIKARNWHLAWQWMV